MQITELLPELITKLAPTGPFPTDVSAQFAYWRQLVTKRQPGDLPKHYFATRRSIVRSHLAKARPR